MHTRYLNSVFLIDRKKKKNVRKNKKSFSIAIIEMRSSFLGAFLVQMFKSLQIIYFLLLNFSINIFINIVVSIMISIMSGKSVCQIRYFIYYSAYFRLDTERFCIMRMLHVSKRELKRELFGCDKIWRFRFLTHTIVPIPSIWLLLSLFLTLSLCLSQEDLNNKSFVVLVAFSSHTTFVSGPSYWGESIILQLTRRSRL